MPIISDSKTFVAKTQSMEFVIRIYSNNDCYAMRFWRQFDIFYCFTSRSCAVNNKYINIWTSSKLYLPYISKVVVFKLPFIIPRIYFSNIINEHERHMSKRCKSDQEIKYFLIW